MEIKKINFKSKLINLIYINKLNDLCLLN